MVQIGVVWAKISATIQVINMSYIPWYIVMELCFVYSYKTIQIPRDMAKVSFKVVQGEVVRHLSIENLPKHQNIYLKSENFLGQETLDTYCVSIIRWCIMVLTISGATITLTDLFICRYFYCYIIHSHVFHFLDSDTMSNSLHSFRQRDINKREIEENIPRRECFS